MTEKISPPLGVSQSWQSVTRTAGTTYYNTTGRPILIVATNTVNNTSTSGTTLTVNGALVFSTVGNGAGIGMVQNVSASAIVPNGASYVFGGATPSCMELR